MRIAITGGRGLVGRWIVAAAQEAGHQIIRLDRPDFELGQRPDLRGCDALIHAAFQHEAGRYRGGEGGDPEGFRRANLDGSLALFRAARDSGVGRVLFLSSRAVHDGHSSASLLADDLPPRPTTLYGEVKAQAEAALSDMASQDFRTASLRPTGVFGPGQPQKWAGLIRDFLAGQPVLPRVATEVHGADLAQAALLVLGDQAMGGSYNVSDLVLDRHELLAGVAALMGSPHRPPMRADARDLSIADCARLAALGWRPQGLVLLHQDLAQIIAESTDPARS
ncbi:NAD(P)-dependent oxidoreductase [Paracoccus sp. (in: a-proteobacteria)]|uniref:NAD-dependent epimerase/dehydratase family protein n=1 Tax=Paracoccus sp. TaxID=267 RepID=UPI0028997766|nr:NAD(P)-dependent oxidoreductase [Paracoccus sp. (in: a-proteobacteria)]